MKIRNPFWGIAAPLIFVCLLLDAQPLRAAEGSIGLGLDLRYALLLGREPPATGHQASHGIGFGARFNYGLLDSLSLRARVFYSVHPRSPRLTHCAHFSFGIGYNLDILRIIPFITIDAGLYLNRLPTDDLEADFGIAFGVGVNYLLNRQWAVGFFGRYHLFISDLGKYPVYLDVGGTVTYFWN